MRRVLVPFSLAVLWLGAASSSSAACDGHMTGSAVDHYISDGVLHRRWAVIADCAHPGRPWIAKETTPPFEQVTIRAATAVQVRLLVAAGAKVILWKDTGESRMQLTGTALEPGRLGDEIRVRVGNASGAVIEGRIKGATLVELIGPVRWNSQ